MVWPPQNLSPTPGSCRTDWSVTMLLRPTSNKAPAKVLQLTILQSSDEHQEDLVYRALVVVAVLGYLVACLQLCCFWGFGWPIIQEGWVRMAQQPNQSWTFLAQAGREKSGAREKKPWAGKSYLSNGVLVKAVFEASKCLKIWCVVEVSISVSIKPHH